MLCNFVLAGTKNLSFKTAKHQKGGASARSRRGGAGILCVYQAVATKTFVLAPPFLACVFLCQPAFGKLFFLFIQRYAHERLLYAEYLRCLGDVEIVKLLIELIYRGKLVLRKSKRFFAAVRCLAADNDAVGI